MKEGSVLHFTDSRTPFGGTRSVASVFWGCGLGLRPRGTVALQRGGTRSVASVFWGCGLGLRPRGTVALQRRGTRSVASVLGLRGCPVFDCS